MSGGALFECCDSARRWSWCLLVWARQTDWQHRVRRHQPGEVLDQSHQRQLHRKSPSRLQEPACSPKTEVTASACDGARGCWTHWQTHSLWSRRKSILATTFLNIWSWHFLFRLGNKVHLTFHCFFILTSHGLSHVLVILFFHMSHSLRLCQELCLRLNRCSKFDKVVCWRRKQSERSSAWPFGSGRHAEVRPMLEKSQRVHSQVVSVEDAFFKCQTQPKVKRLLYQWVWRQRETEGDDPHPFLPKLGTLFWCRKKISFRDSEKGAQVMLGWDEIRNTCVFPCNVLALILYDAMINPQNYHGQLRAGNQVVWHSFFVGCWKDAGKHPC